MSVLSSAEQSSPSLVRSGLSHVTRSTLWQARLIVAISLALVVVLVGLSFWMFKQASDKGAALNIAGSLRMQSYLIALRAVEPHPNEAERRTAVKRELDAFELRLLNPSLLAVLPTDQQKPLRQAYTQVAAHWNGMQALAQRENATARSEFLERVHPFVNDIDRFVGSMQRQLQKEVQQLHLLQFVAALGLMLLLALLPGLLKRQVFNPIEAMTKVAQQVQRGSLATRVKLQVPGEGGELVRQFDRMLDELERLYGSLRAQLVNKGAQVASTSHSLQLMQERTEMARELQDSVAQYLSYTKIQIARLSALLQRIEEKKSAAPESVGSNEAEHAAMQEAVSATREGVSSAYRQLRELLTAFQLRLTAHDLAAVLADAVHDFAQRSSIQARIYDQLNGAQLNAAQQLGLAVILHEALANVVQHADAHEVDLRLRSTSTEVELMVEDDGVGFTPPTDDQSRLAANLEHVGLTIMRDRAAQLGGRLTVEPVRKQDARPGTRIRLSFPLQNASVVAPSHS